MRWIGQKALDTAAEMLTARGHTPGEPFAVDGGMKYVCTGCPASVLVSRVEKRISHLPEGTHLDCPAGARRRR